MVVNSNAGVDPSVLRYHVTDLQQDVPCVPAKKTRGESSGRKHFGQGGRKQRCVCYLMSTVKRLLLVTGF